MFPVEKTSIRSDSSDRKETVIGEKENLLIEHIYSHSKSEIHQGREHRSTISVIESENKKETGAKRGCPIDPAIAPQMLSNR